MRSLLTEYHIKSDGGRKEINKSEITKSVHRIRGSEEGDVGSQITYEWDSDFRINFSRIRGQACS